MEPVPKLTKRQAGSLGGRIGGLSRSRKKILAARRNAKLGGRPRKKRR